MVYNSSHILRLEGNMMIFQTKVEDRVSGPSEVTADLFTWYTFNW